MDEQIMTLLKQDQKIKAIKMMRRHYPYLSLKDAKEYVEGIEKESLEDIEVHDEKR